MNSSPTWDSHIVQLVLGIHHPCETLTLVRVELTYSFSGFRYFFFYIKLFFLLFSMIIINYYYYYYYYYYEK
jgi:hypothetical protein